MILYIHSNSVACFITVCHIFAEIQCINGFNVAYMNVMYAALYDTSSAGETQRPKC